jgi:putative hemolysin
MEESPIKPKVLDYDDICKMVPFFEGKPKLVNFLFKMLKVDKVNWLHENNYKTPGAPFTKGILKDLGITVVVENKEILDTLPEGPFITVSNHPFGALDGITLISELASRRKDYKVMVNLILNYITAMRENFIAVDPVATNDPAKKAVTMRGIREAMMHVKKGHPLGFFPAGSVAKINGKLQVDDRDWQPSIIRLIQQLKVPVIPIYFHGYNSMLSYIMGRICWPLRSLMLPSEVFRKQGATLRMTVGKPISVEEMSQYPGVEELTKFLKDTTFALKK